ncbi:MAG: hypothetical protein ACI4GO_05510 [Hominenteromicrobium sp.]
MEIRLNDGSICQNGLGLPETAEGLDALMQRAYIRLNTVRGSFPYDRTLGSRIPQMAVTTGHAEERALGFAREALLGCPEITAERAEIHGNAVTVFLSTPLGSGSVTVEKEETADEL